MSRTPYMPFFGNDFFGSSRVQLMDAEDQVHYLRLLWFQWTDDGLPADVLEVKKLAPGVGARVIECFPISSDGKRRNPALEKHRRKSKTMSSDQRKRAKSRWDIRKPEMPDACRTDAQNVPSVSVSVSASVPASDIPSPPAPVKRSPKVTWLTPYWDAWIARYGGEPHAGQFVKHLKRPRDALGDAECVARWERYLAATEGRFASPAKFAATHGEYCGTTDLDALIEREKARQCG